MDAALPHNLHGLHDRAILLAGFASDDKISQHTIEPVSVIARSLLQTAPQGVAQQCHLKKMHL